MQTLRLCVFLASIVALRANALTTSLAEFYCVFNGPFSNSEQIKTDGDNRTLIVVKLQPVVAPALSENPVIYLEESIAEVLIRAVILIVEELQAGVITTYPRNFTGNTDIKPGTFNPDTIKSLTPNDLQGQPDCNDVFERVKPSVFSGKYQDCRHPPEKGERLLYVSTLTCDTFVTTVPRDSPEKSTFVPYKLIIQGEKYPLENAPANYVCNCTKPSA